MIRIISWIWIAGFILFALACQQSGPKQDVLPRIIISTDIGGTDPDDFQSMIHLLMYADQFQLEGLISSPYGEGRTTDIHEMIDLYEKDYPQIASKGTFPNPDDLRLITKQGATDFAPHEGWDSSTEGSEWIIQQARKESNLPLWVLVWGGLEDIAQALHDAPDIAPSLRVYWIGGPNKKWSVHPYLYLVRNFPDLWMIEANSTYRGWFLDKQADPSLGNQAFFESNIKGRGAMGTDFGDHYGGEIKMGDTPSLMYVLNGEPEDPTGESWGGSFRPITYSAYRLFQRQTTLEDSLPAYGVIEWTFTSDEPIPSEAGPEIWMEIDGQRINGFSPAENSYSVRFVPKRADRWAYTIHSTASDLDGPSGEFVSVNPWPGPPHPDNLPLGNRWWSDRSEADTYINGYQGANTIAKWRAAFLGDWATRLRWLEE